MEWQKSEKNDDYLAFIFYFYFINFVIAATLSNGYFEI